MTSPSFTPPQPRIPRGRGLDHLADLGDMYEIINRAAVNHDTGLAPALAALAKARGDA